MKKLIYILSLALVAVLASCNPEAVAETEDVSLEVIKLTVSAGFCEYLFDSDMPAYFLTGIIPVSERYEPARYPKQFMNLMLDSAYADYLDWRRGLLLQGIEHVADFSSHCLQYDYADRFFHSLKPDTEYWVYAFVVDAHSNKPVGTLYLDTIRTEAESHIDMHFNYRIIGTWDYIYPIDSLGNLLTNYPWYGLTVDSLELRQRGFTTPGEYFVDEFVRYSSNPSLDVCYGVYSHNNVGIAPSYMMFEPGHTYYTGLALMDGPVLEGQQPKCYDIFRFHWTGDEMEAFMTHEKNNTLGAW